MPTSDIKQFAGGAGAIVLSQADYELLAATTLQNGYPAGILEATLLNKTLRQSLFMAAGLAGWLVTQGKDVLDDGDLATLIANLGNTITGITAPSIVTVTGAVPAAAENGVVAVNAAGATTQTLPAANSVPPGASFSFININTGTASIARAGADTITVNNTTVTALPLATGDTLTLVSNGVSTWYAKSGSSQLKYSSLFALSSAANGYQKLPSGLILQWGATGLITSGSHLAVTFPIAFPTAPLVGVCSFYGSADFATNFTYANNIGSGATTTQMNVYSYSGTSPQPAHWMAVGY